MLLIVNVGRLSIVISLVVVVFASTPKQYRLSTSLISTSLVNFCLLLVLCFVGCGNVGLA